MKAAKQGIKVLRILAELRPSGVETALRTTHDLWAEAGFNVEVLSTGAEVGVYGPALERVGFTIHHIPLQPFHRFLRGYARLLRLRRYDVVHIHTERANFYLAMMARACGVRRVVRSIHNVFPFSGLLGIQRRLQRGFLRRLGVRHLSVSASVQSVEERHLGNPSVLVYNSFDDSRFQVPDRHGQVSAREAIGVNEKEFVLVSVGNCRDAKNHAALLHALANVGRDFSYRYIHVGVEDEQGSERELAQELGIADRVAFLGYVDDVSSVLKAADCFVMPSLYEGLGNAALEALGVGVPSILSDVPGLRDLREFIPYIEWVRPEAGPIREALCRVRSLSPAERAKRRDAISKAAHEAFGRERAVHAYAALYR